MGVGEKIEVGLAKWRVWRRQRLVGPIGDFYRGGGQELLYHALPITSEDIVIDGGGYQGDWTDQMLCRYGCRSIVFEPVPLFAGFLRKRYQQNNRVELLEAAISNKAGQAKISLSMDGSSIFRASESRVKINISLVDFGVFLLNRNIGDIACLKLNIEGGEYDVLEQLISLNFLRKLRSLLVQFHEVDSQSNLRRAAIQEALQITHKCQFDYPFVWECWIRKN